MSILPESMKGVVLPGDRSVEWREYEVPKPLHGQDLVQMRASSICGSDIRAIYREHLGKGPEAYQNVIAGHEPCGVIAAVGPGVRERRVGETVVVYHISGCGCCSDCMHGYQISCHSPTHRKAYGWQRNGGHAAYLLAEEQDLIVLPQNLTPIDGAFLACGFGTAWECLTRMGVCGRDRLLVTGLGPVGLAAALLGKALGVSMVVGVDQAEGRLELAGRLRFSGGTPLIDHVIKADGNAGDAIQRVCRGGVEVSIDCSGDAPARLLALQNTRQWGRCGFVGEGGKVEFDVSPFLIHEQITLYGSWVTSRKHMHDLAEFLGRRDIHPEIVCGPRFALEQADEAYRVADGGETGKVCITF